MQKKHLEESTSLFFFSVIYTETSAPKPREEDMWRLSLTLGGEAYLGFIMCTQSNYTESCEFWAIRWSFMFAL